MTDFEALARDCEAAVGPDRQLDGKIWASIQGVELLIWERGTDSGEVLSFRGALNDPDRYGVGYYTASLDAALTLVPEGFAIRDFMIWPGENSVLKLYGTHKSSEGEYWHVREDGLWSADAKTAPGAIAAAALRARGAIA